MKTRNTFSKKTQYNVQSIYCFYLQMHMKLQKKGAGVMENVSVDTGEAQGLHEEKGAHTTSKGKVARKANSCLQSMTGI